MIGGPFSRKEPEVTAEFRKDAADETFLSGLNKALREFEEESYFDIADEETRATVFVVGAPRSGTTLLSQLLCSCLELGYPSNLVAAFWGAPTVGARLALKLLPRNVPSAFQSTFGRTSGVYEPHEWGYFWFSLLGYSELRAPLPDHDANVDWNRVNRVLRNLGAAFGRPAMYKTFFAPWHTARLLAALPRSLFVHVRREPVDTALSILRMRRQMFGDETHWASFRPSEYEWLSQRPVTEQVAGQAVFTDIAIARNLSALGGHVLTVELADLCREPGRIVTRVRDALGELGDSPEAAARPPAEFALEEPSQDWPDPRERNAVASAVLAFQDKSGKL